MLNVSFRHSLIFTILTNYQVDYWICMPDPSYVSQISIRNPHMNCVWAAIANVDIFKPSHFWDSGAAGWSGLECILWEASNVKPKALSRAKSSLLWLACMKYTFSQIERVRSTIRNKFIHQPAITYKICMEWLPCALYSPRPWRYFQMKHVWHYLWGWALIGLHSLGGTVLMAPIMLTGEPSEKTLSVDSKFPARKHHGRTSLGCTENA